MDASRYFEEMHRAMSAQKNNSSLLLTVKVQDLGGADAYLELRQSPNCLLYTSDAADEL